MTIHTETVTVHVTLSTQGDALIYGSTLMNGIMSGLQLKHRLFAWHEPSFYGTELGMEQVQNIELVILPAEHVISFFAESKLLSHLEWVWDGDAPQIIRLSSLLSACIDQKKIYAQLLLLSARQAALDLG